jgi:hypothetical protein
MILADCLQDLATMPPDDVDIFDAFLPLALRVVPGPCYSFFAGTRGHHIYQALHQWNADVHSLLIWHKTNAKYGAMNSQYKQRHEPILYFKRAGGHTRWAGSSTEATILNFPRDAKNEWHPTQKPVALLEHLIANHDCESVLDPFMGSGSTAVAAIRQGRHFVGIEIDPAHFQSAILRAQKEVDQEKLFPVKI